MQYTPFGNLTDDELVANVLNDEASSARELELVVRIGHLQESLLWYRDEVLEGTGASQAQDNLRKMAA